MWAGGANTLPNGATYTFNMPTEEIYNAPHTSRVDGFIRFSKPCCFAGDMIDDFWLAFQNGEVVDFGASVGYEILKSILNIDEGAKRLGEVAIVPYTNPVNQTGLLFYNTLFDENASCHVAVGNGYATNILGEDRSETALVKKGLNISSTHVGFMFGTADLRCVAGTSDGEEILVMENGEVLL